MNEINQMEQQIEQLKNQMNKIKEHHKKKEELVIKANIKIKLIISDKTFISSSRTLFNKKYGNLLFLEEFMNIHHKANTNNDGDEDIENDTDDIKLEPKLPNLCSQKEIELFFDRDPVLFQYILNYLRGYNLKDELNKMTVIKLSKLRDDALFYKIEALYNLVTLSLYSRFDPFLSSPLIELSNNGRVATRSSKNVSIHKSAAVYGVLEMPSNGSCQRYVEFNIISQADRCIMIGVTESRPFRVAPYPGHAGVSGCAIYGNNGYLYRSSSYEGWSNTWTYGDKIGILVKLNKDNDTATVAFYYNGGLVKNELDLKTYMNVNNGIIFVANMYAANDQVQLVRNPVVPQ